MTPQGLNRTRARRFSPEDTEYARAGSLVSLGSRACQQKPPRRSLRRLVEEIHHEEANVLGRPGGDLLFQVLRLSTIGAGKFDGRVRDGIG